MEVIDVQRQDAELLHDLRMLLQVMTSGAQLLEAEAVSYTHLTLPTSARV